MKITHIFSIFLIGMSILGCRKPSNTEHQEFINLSNRIKNSTEIESKNEKLGAELTGVYGASIPPDIFIDLFYEKEFSSKGQMELSYLIEKERNKLKISQRLKIRYLTGDNLKNKVFGSFVVK